MNAEVMRWAERHGVPYQAIVELRAIFRVDVDPPHLAGVVPHTEAYVQSVVRLEAARKGLKLWRNNVGVLMDVNGRPVRYGLANDSKRLNESVKSGDLIGWRSIEIRPSDVGNVVAQFVSRECKTPGWRYTGTEHEQAQVKWAMAVIADGGDAQFCTGEGTL